MGYVEDAQRRAKEIRKRLRNPPNAVKDSGINLTRYSSVVPTEEPLPIEEPEIPLEPPEFAKVEVVEKQSPLTIHNILTAVSTRFGVSPHDVKGHSRAHKISEARAVVAYLSAKILNQALKRHTLTTIAKALNKDHTSIIYARDRIENALTMNPALAAAVAELEGTILGSNHA